MTRLYKFKGRKLKLYTCKYCGERFTNLNDYKYHLIKKHDAVMVPITKEDFSKIQQFILSSKCPESSELREFFRLGYLLSKDFWNE